MDGQIGVMRAPDNALRWTHCVQSIHRNASWAIACRVPVHRLRCEQRQGHCGSSSHMGHMRPIFDQCLERTAVLHAGIGAPNNLLPQSCTWRVRVLARRHPCQATTTISHCPPVTPRSLPLPTVRVAATRRLPEATGAAWQIDEYRGPEEAGVTEEARGVGSGSGNNSSISGQVSGRLRPFRIREAAQGGKVGCGAVDTLFAWQKGAGTYHMRHGMQSHSTSLAKPKRGPEWVSR